MLSSAMCTYWCWCQFILHISCWNEHNLRTSTNVVSTQPHCFACKLSDSLLYKRTFKKPKQNEYRLCASLDMPEMSNWGC